MRIQIFQPVSFLARYIQHYWILETDVSEKNLCERVVPVSHIELLFHFRTPFYEYDNTRILKQPSTVLSGIKNRYSDVYAGGGSGVIAVSFKSEGACCFFDFPLNLISGISVNLLDTGMKKADVIQDKLCFCSSDTERISLIEQFLMSNFHEPSSDKQNFLIRSMNCIRYHQGGINSGEMAEELCMTRRSLERKFSQYFGKSPKQFLRIFRFENAVSHLNSSDSYAKQAVNSGYCDQAHFIHEFREFSGYTPHEYRIKCKNIQEKMQNT